MDVGKRITELRKAKGLTTNRLANLSGLSQSFVRSVELGEKGITVENLGLLCDALDISLRDFFDVPQKAPINKPFSLNGLAATWGGSIDRLSESSVQADDLAHQISLLSRKQRQSLAEFLKNMQI